MQCGRPLSISGLVFTQHDFLNEYGRHFVILTVEECGVQLLHYFTTILMSKDWNSMVILLQVISKCLIRHYSEISIVSIFLGY